jgi:hypothetical protein
MSILLGKSVDFVVLRRHLNRCGFMDEHVSTFVSQPGLSPVVVTVHIADEYPSREAGRQGEVWRW